MNEVYILDEAGSILVTVKFKDDHFALMAKRKWIVQDAWIVKNRTVCTMSVKLLEQFLKEAA